MKEIRMTTNWKNWKKSTKCIVCGFILISVILAFYIPNIFYGGTTQISSASQLLSLATQSKAKSLTDTYELTQDIDLSGYDFSGIGSEEFPFMGSFDGNGYTISGLGVLQIQNTYSPQSGLFVYIENATITDLQIKGAKVTPETGGGIVATEAVNSTFTNVSVEDATLDITLQNNVPETSHVEAGFAGGLVGYAKDCTFYDCEVRNSTIGSNQKNITANIGEGFYVGGLVGVADNTMIEYSRVIDGLVDVNISTQIAALDRTFIHNGGIVGSLKNGSSVIDSFSSTNLNTDVEMAMQTAVGVSNYFGGIAASMEGENCVIKRCHFSGMQTGTKKNTARGTELAFYMTGICGYVEDENVGNITYAYYDYDKLLAESEGTEELVLTALRRENGANRGETENVKRLDSASYTTESSFETFDYVCSKANEYGHKNKWIMDETAKMPMHGDSFGARLDFPGAGSVTIEETKRSDGETLHGAIVTTSVNDSARQYTESEATDTVTLTATINEGYHFAGWYRTDNWFSNIPYTSLDGWKEMVTQTDASKLPEGTTWTMGTINGNTNTYDAPAEDDDFYLAHVQAEIKFMPLGGSATGAPTATVYYDYMDKMGDNSGYRIAINAVQSAAVTAGQITAKNGVFAGWTTQEGGIADAGLLELSTLGSAFYGQTTIVTEPLVLYPVFIQDASKIVFTTIEAGTTDRDGNDTQVSCFGNDYGYNTRVLEQYDASKRYTASVDFENLNDGSGSYKCILSLKDSDGNRITDDSIWKDSGYRFLGWYRIETTNAGAIVYDENGKPNAARISRELETELPTETSLSGIRLYEARFEYQVQYWAEYDKIEYIFPDGYEYASEWFEYGENFLDINGPKRMAEDFYGWYTGVDGGWAVQKAALETITNTGTGNEVAPFNGGGQKLTLDTIITEPMYAFSDYESDDTNYTLLFMSDFPFASSSLVFNMSSGFMNETFNFTTEEKEGYHFWGWTQQHIDAGDKILDSTSYFYESSEDRETWKNDKYLWSHSINKVGLSFNEYVYAAHYYADVNFITKDEKSTTVYRRYQDDVFRTEDITATYGSWDNDIDPMTVTAIKSGNHDGSGSSTQTMITIGASPSDEEMKVDGYRFLGWIDAAEIGYDPEKSYEDQSYMYRYIYDNPDDPFVTMHENRAEGLLWRSTDDIQVTETMTLIPVYTYDFSVEVTSNLSSLSSSLDYRVLRNAEDTGFDIYLTTNTEIDTTNYPFMGWYYNGTQVVDQNGNAAALNDEVADFTILDTEVSAALAKSTKPVYTFTANFNIRTTYHDAGADGADVVKAHSPNKVLGTTISTLKPVETPEDSYFIGWTTMQPTDSNKGTYSQGDYHVISDLDGQYGITQYATTGVGGGLADFLLTGEEIVQAPMDIYPIYVHLDTIRDNISVTSNMAGTDYEDSFTAGLGLDAAGLYLETTCTSDGYMLVDWKKSTDGSAWSFFTTLDKDTTKYYISIPAWSELLDTAKDDEVIEYYRADYGVKITYCGLTNDVLYEHGLLAGTQLLTYNYETKQSSYYKDVPMDIMTHYVSAFGERYGCLSYSNRMYTKEVNASGETVKTSFNAYVNMPIYKPLTFYLDIYMIYAMDTQEKLCALSDYKIGFAEDGSMNAYLLEDYTKEQYSNFLVGINEMNHGETLPIGVNEAQVNLYLQRNTDTGVTYGLYQSTETANHDPVYISTVISGTTYQIPLSAGIAEFAIVGSMQLSMADVDGYIPEDEETFFLYLTPPENSDATQLKVAIHPGETVTVTNLTFGDWTIEQDTAWAWRYTPVVVGDTEGDVIKKTVTVASAWAEDTAVTFDNERNDNLSFTDEESTK